MENSHLTLKLFVLIFILNSAALVKAQTGLNLDQKWDNYYDQYPTSIRTNYEGTDFIKVIKDVNFSPNMREIKGDQDMFIRVILSLSLDALRQMSIDGDYYSRTKKHNDYYLLYNMNYEDISKDKWNRLCPYLIPLMSIDGIVKLR